MGKVKRRHQLVIRHMPLFRSMPAEVRVPSWLRLAINSEFRFAYIRIPKAANSTVTRALALRAYPGKRDTIEADPRGREAKALFELLSPRQCLTRTCLKRRFYTFSFFRDPYSRLLSAYLDKLCSGYSKSKKRWNRKLEKLSLDSEASFEDFVTSLERGNLYKNVHWAPQTRICPIPVDQLDFAGRVESLEADLAAVTAKLFGEENSPAAGQREHNRQNAHAKLSTYYTPDLLERVYHLYRDDFEQLGYEPMLLPNMTGHARDDR